MPAILTGIDKLIKLINQKGKLSLQEAAKALGTTPKVIKEWATYLEEEGVLEISYGFSKTFIIAKKVSKSKIEQKKKRTTQRAASFESELANTHSQLDKLSKTYDTHVNNLSSINKDLVGKLKTHIDALHEYESLHSDIQTKVAREKEAYLKKIDNFNKALGSEKGKYGNLLQNIELEETKLDQDLTNIEELKQIEKRLKDKILALKGIAEKVGTRVETKVKDVETVKSDITKLHEKLSLLHNDVKRKRTEDLEPLVKKHTAFNKKIEVKQRSLLSKIELEGKKVNLLKQEINQIKSGFQKSFDSSERK